MDHHYIVGKETWSVPTILTSSQNQFKWILIKTTVNEQNIRWTYDERFARSFWEPLGTFKTRSLKVYMAESEGLFDLSESEGQDILRYNVLPMSDSGDILAIWYS